MKRIIILGIAVLLSALPAAAGTQTIELLPPSDTAGRTWGLAQTVDRGEGTEVFSVRADVGWRDGTELVVGIELEDRDGQRDWYDVALITVRLGTAFMELDSRQDISPAFPVAAILGVRVERGETTILVGSFEDSGG
jgi:hypothetical protein